MVSRSPPCYCDGQAVFGVPKHRLQAPFTLVVAGSSSFTGVTVNDHPDDARLTRDLAAHAADVKPSTVAMWASRGWVDPVTGERRKLEVAARDWRGRPLFRYTDVMAAEQATRRRGRKRDKQTWAALDINSAGFPLAS